jgi:hypothetical protein
VLHVDGLTVLECPDIGSVVRALHLLAEKPPEHAWPGLQVVTDR